MDGSDAIQILVLAMLLGLSAFFSASETALSTVNRIRIRTLSEQGNKRAMKVMILTEKPDKMLSAILIGNNIVNLSASSLATTWTMNMFGSKAVGLATGVVTLLVLIFGEITPKTMATARAEKISLRVAGVIWCLTIILTPLIMIVGFLAGMVIRLLSGGKEEKHETITEEELRTIVDVSNEEGVIENDEKKMINNVVDFGDIVAKDIMIPRIDMVYIKSDASYDDIIEIYSREKYTRYPVCEDSTDRVVGIINVKDLIMYDKSTEFDINNYIREPLFTYEYKKTSELLNQMLKSTDNIAIVLDEYGVTAGLITLEDLLEEIVGEIRDEYDEDEKEGLVALGNGEYLIDGAMRLEDINENIGTSLVSEDYESIGGLIIGKLDHIPEVGEEITEDGVRMVVESMDKARIEKVHVYT